MNPTAELAKAKEVLAQAGKAGKKSRNKSMLAWLKTNPCPAASQSRDSERELWLQKFVVLQLRGKTSTSNVSQVVENKKSEFSDMYWWAQEQMEKNLGKFKTEAWVQSGLLKHRPCSLTGKDTEMLREHRIPVQWERMSNDDLKRWALESAGAATAEDMNLMADFSTTASSSGEGGAKDSAKEGAEQVVVKAEPLSKTEQEEKTMKEFIAALDTHIERAFQMEMSTKNVGRPREVGHEAPEIYGGAG